MTATSICFRRPFTKLKLFLRGNSTEKTTSSTMHRVVVVDVSLVPCASWVSYAKWIRPTTHTTLLPSTRRHTDFLIFRGSLQFSVTLITVQTNVDMIFSPYSTHTHTLPLLHPSSGTGMWGMHNPKMTGGFFSSQISLSLTLGHKHTSSLPICPLFLIVMWESHCASMRSLFTILINILIVIMTFRQ